MTDNSEFGKLIYQYRHAKDRMILVVVMLVIIAVIFWGAGSDDMLSGQPAAAKLMTRAILAGGYLAGVLFAAYSYYRAHRLSLAIYENGIELSDMGRVQRVMWHEVTGISDELYQGQLILGWKLHRASGKPVKIASFGGSNQSVRDTLYKTYQRFAMKQLMDRLRTTGQVEFQLGKRSIRVTPNDLAIDQKTIPLKSIKRAEIVGVRLWVQDSQTGAAQDFLMIGGGFGFKSETIPNSYYVPLLIHDLRAKLVEPSPQQAKANQPAQPFESPLMKKKVQQ